MIHTDIKEQLVGRFKKGKFGFFSLQIDESTDIKNNSVMSIFVRWAEKGKCVRRY